MLANELFAEIAKALGPDELKLLSRIVRARAGRYETGFEQLFDELDELALVYDGSRLSRNQPLKKRSTVNAQLGDLARGRTGKQVALYLRWLWNKAPTHVPLEWRQRFNLPLPTPTNSAIAISADRNSRTSDAAATVSPAFDKLIEVGRSQNWAQLAEMTPRSDLRGIGALFVPTFPVGSIVQVHIDPPMDGFISLFNIDKATGTEGDAIYLLDALFSSRDVVAYKGEKRILPSATSGLPVGGKAGMMSTLLVCISAISVFDLWHKHLMAGSLFQPEADQGDQFSRLFFAQEISKRAACAIQYQT